MIYTNGVWDNWILDNLTERVGGSAGWRSGQQYSHFKLKYISKGPKLHVKGEAQKCQKKVAGKKSKYNLKNREA